MGIPVATVWYVVQPCKVKSFHLQRVGGDRKGDKTMAYLNCPFCPAQSYPVRTEDFPQLGCHMDKFRCSSQHIFYTKMEEDDVSRTVTVEARWVKEGKRA